MPTNSIKLFLLTVLRIQDHVVYTTQSARVEALIEHIQRDNDAAFADLLEVLECSGNRHVAEVSGLRVGYFSESRNWSTLI